MTYAEITSGDILFEKNCFEIVKRLRLRQGDENRCTGCRVRLLLFSDETQMYSEIIHGHDYRLKSSAVAGNIEGKIGVDFQITRGGKWPRHPYTLKDGFTDPLYIPQKWFIKFLLPAGFFLSSTVSLFAACNNIGCESLFLYFLPFPAISGL